jgi:hypothetical protein
LQQNLDKWIDNSKKVLMGGVTNIGKQVKLKITANIKLVLYLHGIKSITN